MVEMHVAVFPALSAWVSSQQRIHCKKEMVLIIHFSVSRQGLICSLGRPGSGSYVDWVDLELTGRSLTLHMGPVTVSCLHTLVHSNN